MRAFRLDCCFNAFQITVPYCYVFTPKTAFHFETPMKDAIQLYFPC